MRVKALANVGADPEFFILDEANRPVAAHLLNFPYKYAPLKLGRGAVLRDGYAVELNPRFSVCRTELIRNFWDSIQVVDHHFGLSAQGYKLVAKSAVKVDLTYVKRWPADVGDFGCDGAWNAYTGELGGPKINGYVHPLRYSGGHLHASYNKGVKVPWAQKPASVFTFIKFCDRFPGLISTYLVGSPAAGLRRKSGSLVAGEDGFERPRQTGLGRPRWLGHYQGIGPAG